MTKILFLGGPSGVGKSTFASCFLSSRGWTHIEIDRFPEGDGIDMADLRQEWNTYLNGCNAIPLERRLRTRAGDKPRMVLTFPGGQIFSERHVESAKNRFHIAYLYGHPAYCFRAFTGREKTKKEPLSQDHWTVNNLAVFAFLAEPRNHPRLVEAFLSDGLRRPPQDMLADIEAIMDGLE